MQQVSAGLRDVLGMTRWRKEHPKATFQEIEEAVDERVNQLRAQLIQTWCTWVNRSMGPEESAERPNVRAVASRCRGAESRPAGSKRRAEKRSSCANVWRLPGVWGRLFSPWMKS